MLHWFVGGRKARVEVAPMTRKRKKKPADVPRHPPTTVVMGRFNNHRLQAIAVCVLLILAVVLVFGQTARHEFVNFDDHAYVYENPHVTHGLTRENVVWAFTSVHSANWHPLTWLSHIVDWQLYGRLAGGHHLTNVLLHASNAILLFLVLWRMTGGLWLAALAAALFAVHPLRVESVAWVSERKDVLSGFLFLLTLAAYVGYVRHPFSWLRYLAVIVLFALGLMAKPMLVTLPPVLLLLDYWPLGRMGIVKPRPVVASLSATTGRGFTVGIWRLILEKLPLFALAVASCVATTLAQREAIAPLEQLTFPARMANVVVSYAAYIGQFFWPVGLSAFYPHQRPHMPMSWVLLAIVVLAVISAVAYVRWRRTPCLIVGWLWYLGMLVPVVGLVQVGDQARADRYTYLPEIGLAVALVWGIAEAVQRWPRRRMACSVVSALAIAVLAFLAWHQTAFWRTSELLWTHAIACTDRNYVAHNNLGSWLIDNHRLDEAIRHCQQAVQLRPGYADAHANLGAALGDRGENSQAVEHLLAAIQLDPTLPRPHNNLANILANTGKVDEAIAEYRKAIQLQSDYLGPHVNMGAVLFRGGRYGEATVEYRKAAEIKPDDPQIHFNLGNALIHLNQVDDGIAHYREALKLKPDYAKAHFNLGYVLADRGQLDEAIACYREAIKHQPDFEQAKQALADALEAKGRRHGP